MPALSLDLRQRIIAAHGSGKYSVRQIAEIFTVAKATVKSLVRLWRETGKLTPRKKGPPEFPIWTDTNLHKIVREIVEEKNDGTLEEYCRSLEKRTETRISVPQMCELLQQLKLYRKKKLSARPKEIARESNKRVRIGRKKSA